MGGVTVRTIERDFMDDRVAPCDDFYRYATGAWADRTKIPEDQSVWGGFSELHERNQNVLHGILEESARSSSSDADVRLVGDLYASGMDEAVVDRAGLSDVKDVLAGIDRLETVDELARVFALLQSIRVAAPFALAIQPDAFDSSRNLVHIGQAGLGLPDRDYYLRTDEKSVELQQRYREHVAETLRILGAGDGEAKAQSDAIYALEHDIATHRCRAPSSATRTR